MAEHKMDKSSLELGSLPSNSMKSKQKTEGEPKEIKQVATAKVQKKPASKRFLESIGVEDGRTVGDYILWDVILPSAKDMIASVVKNGIDVFLYGQVRSKNVKRSGSSSRVSYGSYYEDGPGNAANRRRPGYSYNHKAAMDFSNVVFDERVDAEMVLSEMVEIVEQYGFCKVSDFLSLSGVDDSQINFTDHNLGWDRLGSAGVDRVRDGYVLALPRPTRLD